MNIWEKRFDYDRDFNKYIHPGLYLAHNPNDYFTILFKKERNGFWITITLYNEEGKELAAPGFPKTKFECEELVKLYPPDGTRIHTSKCNLKINKEAFEDLKLKQKGD